MHRGIHGKSQHHLWTNGLCLVLLVQNRQNIINMWRLLNIIIKIDLFRNKPSPITRSRSFLSLSQRDVSIIGRDLVAIKLIEILGIVR